PGRRKQAIGTLLADDDVVDGVLTVAVLGWRDGVREIDEDVAPHHRAVAHPGAERASRLRQTCVHDDIGLDAGRGVPFVAQTDADTFAKSRTVEVVNDVAAHPRVITTHLDTEHVRILMDGRPTRVADDAVFYGGVRSKEQGTAERVAGKRQAAQGYARRTLAAEAIIGEHAIHEARDRAVLDAHVTAAVCDVDAGRSRTWTLGAAERMALQVQADAVCADDDRAVASRGHAIGARRVDCVLRVPQQLHGSPAIVSYTAGMRQDPLSFLNDELASLKQQNLYRRLRILEDGQQAKTRVDGRSVVNLSSNNYLGLTTHPHLRAKAIEAVERYGAGTGSVRTIAGTMDLHMQLEERLAAFKKTEAVVVFQSGFTANAGTVSSILGRDDVIISDELNHASIIDGARLSRATIKVFPHGDADAARGILKDLPASQKKLLITDGVFSMDGDLGPLPALVDVAEE